jgi:hypothetical protein
MKNYTRKKRLTNKKRPRRSYKSGKSIKRKRGGGGVWDNLFKKPEKPADSNLYSIAPAVVEQPVNRHHKNMTKQEEEKSKANNIEARQEVKPSASDAVYNVFTRLPRKISKTLNPSRAFKIPGKTDFTNS